MCDESETKKQQRAPKIFFDGRKEFIRHIRKTGAMDIKRLQVTDSSYIEGAICLVNERIGVKEIVFQAWAHKHRHKTRNGWYLGLVARISSIVGLLVLYS